MIMLRHNEFKDLLEMNECLFEEFDFLIQADIPEIGNITYYPKSNKLQIHKGNEWKEEGYNFIKKHFKKLEENLYTEKEMFEFADYCRTGLTNIEYSVDKLKQHLQDWKNKTNNK